MWASGPTIYNLMRFKLSMLVLKIKYLPIILVYSGWPTTLNSVGDCLEVTTLHTLVHKFQPEREVHPPAPPCLRAWALSSSIYTITNDYPRIHELYMYIRHTTGLNRLLNQLSAVHDNYYYITFFDMWMGRVQILWCGTANWPIHLNALSIILPWIVLGRTL